MRITPQARQVAARLGRRAHDALDDVLDDGDELEGGIGDILGGIPLIGGLLGGGGGKPAADAAPPSAAPVDAGMAAAMTRPSGAGGATEVAVHHATQIAKRPTSGDLRNIVKDAIAAHAATTHAAALQTAAHARLADEHAQRVTDALTPRARATHGGIQEQRLQAQATAEHHAIMRRERLERETRGEHDRILAKLDTLLTQVAEVRRRLGGAELVRGRAIDILGGRDALERHR